MAKKKNQEEIQVTDDIEQQADADAPIFIPDIPAQLEDAVTATVNAEINIQVAEKPDTDEILFLRKILQIQEEGCFGRHLNTLINDRIKELKK